MVLWGLKDVQFPPDGHTISYPLSNAARQDQAHAHMVRGAAGEAARGALSFDEPGAVITCSR